jgi:hypothetical protein
MDFVLRFTYVLISQHEVSAKVTILFCFHRRVLYHKLSKVNMTKELCDSLESDDHYMVT